MALHNLAPTDASRAMALDARGLSALKQQAKAAPGEALRAAAGSEKDPVVVISADAHATHQAVIRVMDAARRAGYPRVTFVTQSSESAD